MGKFIKNVNVKSWCLKKVTSDEGQVTRQKQKKTKKNYPSLVTRHSLLDEHRTASGLERVRGSP